MHPTRQRFEIETKTDRNKSSHQNIKVQTTRKINGNNNGLKTRRIPSKNKSNCKNKQKNTRA